tara:strand:+ start:45 stop:836 length:792 start_codon:yes stop_codon:yes gene_type:complete
MSSGITMSVNELKDLKTSTHHLWTSGYNTGFNNIISKILHFEDEILDDDIKQMIINRNYIYNLGLRNKFPIQEFMDNIYHIIDVYIQKHISDNVYWCIENLGCNHTGDFQNWISQYYKIKQFLQHYLLGCEKQDVKYFNGFHSNSKIPNNMICVIKFKDTSTPTKLVGRSRFHLLKCVKSTPKLIKYEYTEKFHMETENGQFKRSVIEDMYFLPNIRGDDGFVMFSRIFYDFTYGLLLNFGNKYKKIQKFNNKQDWFNFKLFM